MIEQLENKFTKYEVARILGARALQITMDAPILLKITKEELEAINYDPLEIAKKELISDVLPVTVKRPLPKKRELKIKKISDGEVDELKKKEDKLKSEEDKEIKESEQEEEKRIEEEGEIMELANPDDEYEGIGESPEEDEI